MGEPPGVGRAAAHPAAGSEAGPAGSAADNDQEAPAVAAGSEVAGGRVGMAAPAGQPAAARRGSGAEQRVEAPASAATPPRAAHRTIAQAGSKERQNPVPPDSVAPLRAGPAGEALGRSAPVPGARRASARGPGDGHRPATTPIGPGSIDLRNRRAPEARSHGAGRDSRSRRHGPARPRRPSRKVKSSLRDAGPSRRHSPRTGPPGACSSRHNAARPSRRSCCMPRPCGSPSSRSKAAR